MHSALLQRVRAPGLPTARPCSRRVRCRAADRPEEGLRCPPRPLYIPNRIDDPNYVRIFDTTLRDGEQSPGCTLTSKEKLSIAKQLYKLGVDVIEAGFPVASPDDFEGVRSIAQEVGNTVRDDGYVPAICAFARPCDSDIQRAWDAVKFARFPRVNFFIATSEIHMKHKLRMTGDQVTETVVGAIRNLRAMGCTDIEFTPEDAGRSDPLFLYEVLGEAIRAGATTLNITDTVGWCLPHEFLSLMAGIKRNVEGVDDVVLSSHCHNDLGQAASNTLMAAVGGARQLEVTINGIGERAGNASAEEVIMAIALRGERLMGGLRTGIQPVHLSATSKMVAEYSGMMVQPHKAVVGANAFAHESGIHQDGMLKARETYEIIRPESIGLVRDCDAGLVLGKHSGRKALGTKLKQMGFELPAEQLNEVFKRFKGLADKKKSISDEDVLALVNEEVHAPPTIITLVDLQVMCGSVGTPTATVSLRGPDGVVRRAAGMGNGPVDAAYKAIESLSPVKCKLLDYSVSSITEGIDALVCTRVTVKPAEEELEGGGMATVNQGRLAERRFHGSGADEDIIMSSARAYISALNKAIAYLAAKKQISTLRKAAGPAADETVPAVSPGTTHGAATAPSPPPVPPPAPAPAPAADSSAGSGKPAHGRQPSGGRAVGGRTRRGRRQLVARAATAEEA
ncbi:hypothetical protein ABPG77_003209 [Micractinium sp. CCAP 211/92]